MSYTLHCPNCGNVLGSGHVQDHPEGGASLNFQVSAVKVPEEQVQHLIPEARRASQEKS